MIVDELKRKIIKHFEKVWDKYGPKLRCSINLLFWHSFFNNLNICVSTDLLLNFILNLASFYKVYTFLT